MRLTRRTSCPAVGVRSSSVVAVVVTLAAVCVACGGSGSSAEAGASGATPSTASGPVGIMAIGHSGLTAENSDPDQPGVPIPENSWATGTSRQVDSVYLRMVAAAPETEGHVVNAAVGGAPVIDLPAQAQGALLTLPDPALIIIQTIDNDIRCDGTDARNVRDFGATIKQVLTSLSTTSPDSEILMVGQLGRPEPAYIRRLVAAHPEVKPDLSGSSICAFYDEHGRLNPPGFARLTAIIDAYETEQARVCAQFPTCHTDGGVRAKYQDTLANFSSDLNHLNVRGQAAEAALIWPVVAQILGVG
jgi:lysophospholipase L1-like esterase